MIERTDFIAVPVQDRERAAQFYGEVLGLTKNPNSTDGWWEWETGNVTLAFVDPETIGMPFAPLPVASIVLRVADLEDRTREARGSRSPARGRRDRFGRLPDAAVHATPRATASCSITATRRIPTGRCRDYEDRRGRHSVPRDWERSRAFYVDTLGLRSGSEREGRVLGRGHVLRASGCPSSGARSSARSTTRSRCFTSTTSRRRRPSSRRRASSSTATPFETRPSATWRRSSIPTATSFAPQEVRAV